MIGFHLILRPRDHLSAQVKKIYMIRMGKTMFIAALFTIARTWKQPKCPSTDEWIKKMCTYIQWTITQP